jgi:SAM-dependent methyltransferase
VAEAFSRKARVYDEFGQDHENLARMRAHVRRHALRFLRPGDRILELNAGTGADALFFARLGYRVHATDLSPGMVARIEAKVAASGLGRLISVQQCSFAQLDRVSAGPFQYVFSNMGGVNCLDDLTQITRGLPALLAPGAVVTWVVMPPFCPWELLAALRGDWKTAGRRLHRPGTLADVAGVKFMTYYFWPGQVQRAFGPRFQPLALQGLSVFTPPADRKEFPARHPRLYAALRFLDDRFAGLPPFNRWGDFFILSLQYRPGAGPGAAGG